MYFFSNGLINNSDVQVGKKIHLLGIENKSEEQINILPISYEFSPQVNSLDCI